MAVEVVTSEVSSSYIDRSPLTYLFYERGLERSGWLALGREGVGGGVWASGGTEGASPRLSPVVSLLRPLLR